MTLPGKLCVGILEEDNPLKSFFRFKPLLIAQEGGYQPFSSAEPFPESGCLRIVPDKNESGHFKVRMRRIGRYALLDLREHPGENDKIRPNKNYHADPGENNAYIPRHGRRTAPARICRGRNLYPFERAGRIAACGRAANRGRPGSGRRTARGARPRACAHA